MAFSELFRRAVSEHEAAVSALKPIESEVEQAATVVVAALRIGNKVLLCGNGGSAADAQHLAAEFVGRFMTERRALPALALHADTSAITAIANDYGFDAVYARQVEAHGRKGDVLMAISTSGASESVVLAAQAARRAGLTVVALTGRGGGRLKDFCDVWIGVPSDVTARIQECHILIGHAICEFAEANAQ